MSSTRQAERVDRTPSKSMSADMSTPSKRSAREWSASAVEADRKAKREAERQRQLHAQLEALQNQLREAAENEQRNNEQAALDRQAAKDEEFYETSLVKQSNFRVMMADEVFTRVSQTLKSDEDVKYMLGIAAGEPGFENPTIFKAMLWEAVAGSESSFVRSIATRVADRYRKPISDEEIQAIKASVSCLDGKSVAFAQRNIQIPSGKVETDPREPGEVPTEPAQLGTVSSPKVIVAESMKEERLGQDHRNAMDKLEDATPAGITEAATDIEIDVRLTDVLGNPINEDEAPEMTGDNSNGTNPIQHSTPMTPSSPSNKRSREDEFTPSPNELASTGTPKKRKTASSKGTPKTPSKFQKHIQTRVDNGNFDPVELMCSKCSEHATNPRVSTKCFHVYCFQCFNAMKKGLQVKQAHSVKCYREGCQSALGAMSKVSEDIIKEFQRSATETASQEQTGVRHGSYEDMTDEDY